MTYIAVTILLFALYLMVKNIRKGWAGMKKQEERLAEVTRRLDFLGFRDEPQGH